VRAKTILNDLARAVSETHSAQPLERDIGYLIFNVLVFGVMFSCRSSQAVVAKTRWEFAAAPIAERKQA
jgi:hypothetical protein